MVAGKVRIPKGFHRSPATHRRNHQQDMSSPPPSNSSNQKPAVFSRSFGVYFPRSSAQVHAAAATRSHPDHHLSVVELFGQVEELREREARLEAQLLEYKLLKESVLIIPILERRMAERNAEIDDSKRTIERLEKENERLRRKIEEQKRERERREREMEADIAGLRKTASFKESDSHGLSASQRLQGLVEASAKSNLMKSVKRVGSSRPESEPSPNPDDNSNSCFVVGSFWKRDDLETVKPSHSPCCSEKMAESTEFSAVVRSRVPKPPPRPSRAMTSSSAGRLSSSDSSYESTWNASTPTEGEKPVPPPPPPPPPPPRSFSSSSAALSLSSDSSGISTSSRISPIPPSTPSPVVAMSIHAPPPPPLPPPTRSLRPVAEKVRRVPEVVEFYHSLIRRDSSSSRRDSSSGAAETAVLPVTANARDMICEIENRSAYLLAIKSDVETQGDFIRFLIKEVENAAFTDIEDVVRFVKWLDDELSHLVDERAVLKHFDWPERKADALREAAFGFCDLKKLESEASRSRDDPRQPSNSALKKMQALLEKLEHSVYNLSRMRESAAKRYKDFGIPVDWMVENGIVSQIKLASVKLAMRYMKRVLAELETVDGGPEEEELMVRGVRFAFRVHQFAGGFDVETMRAFQELRDKARSCCVQNQNQTQQKLVW